MNKHQRFKFVAKVALAMGPALVVVSLLGLSGLIELSPEAIKFSAPGILLGCLTTVLGIQGLRA